MEVTRRHGQLSAEGNPAERPIRGRGLGPMILVGIVAILLAVHGLRKTRFQPARIDSTSLVAQSNHSRFDPNTADLRELSLIPGLGPSLAEKIVVLRREQRFNKPQDLLAVPGIGPGTLGKIRDWFIWEEKDSFDDVQNLVGGKQEAKTHEAVLVVRPLKLKTGDPLVDLNKAGVDDLLRLPGVGPTLARRIVEERGVKPFSSVDDLMRVPGIGPKTFTKIKSMIKAVIAER